MYPGRGGPGTSQDPLFSHIQPYSCSFGNNPLSLLIFVVFWAAFGTWDLSGHPADPADDTRDP